MKTYGQGFVERWTYFEYPKKGHLSTLWQHVSRRKHGLFAEGHRRHSHIYYTQIYNVFGLTDLADVDLNTSNGDKLFDRATHLSHHGKSEPTRY